MKIKVMRDHFVTALSIAVKAVTTKATMPILSNVLIDASLDEIKITGNDLELAIQTIVAGDILEKGIIAIDAKMLLDVIRKMPNDMVTLETDEAFNVHIKCLKTKLDIAGKSGNEYPFIPILEESQSFELSQKSLKEMIRYTMIAISNDTSNKIMTGAHMKTEEGNMWMTALDGHRIARRHLSIEDKSINSDLIIPGKSLAEISKVLKDDDTSIVTISFSKNHISFELGETMIVSRLIEGMYLKVDKIINAEYKLRVEMDRKQFLESIDRATLLVNDAGGRPLILSFEDMMLNLEMVSKIGTLNESILIQKDGENLKIGFNPRLIADALKIMNDETIIMYLNTKSTPAIIEDVGSTYKYFVLPVNIRE